MEEKIQRLKKLLTVLKSMRVSDNSIEKLTEMIESEYDIEYFANQDLTKNYYLNNLRQTREKQLAVLLSKKPKPRKRISYFESTVENFEHDIKDELSRITFKNNN